MCASYHHRANRAHTVQVRRKIVAGAGFRHAMHAPTQRICGPRCFSDMCAVHDRVPLAPTPPLAFQPLPGQARYHTAENGNLSPVRHRHSPITVLYLPKGYLNYLDSNHQNFDSTIACEGSSTDGQSMFASTHRHLYGHSGTLDLSSAAKLYSTAISDRQPRTISELGK